MATTKESNYSASKASTNPFLQNENKEYNKAQFKRLNARKDLTGKQKFAEYITFEETVKRMTQITDYKSSQNKHDDKGEWIEIIILNDGFFMGCTGRGYDHSKKKAIEIVYEQLWASMAKRDEAVPDVFDMSSLLLQAGDIESNPGPVFSIRKSDVEIDRDIDYTEIKLPNGYTFMTENHCITYDETHIHIRAATKRTVAELQKELDIRVEPITEGKTKIQIRREQETTNHIRKNVWSNHADYDAYLRLELRTIKVLHDQIGPLDQIKETEGKIIAVGDFLFVPRNALTIRFKKTITGWKEINISHYHALLASLSRQTLDLLQFARSAIRLTQVQMFYMLVKDPTPKQQLSLFYYLLNGNLMVLKRERSTNFSARDLWNVIKKERPIIPYKFAALNKPTDLLVDRDGYWNNDDGCQCLADEELLSTYTAEVIQKMLTPFEFKDPELLADAFYSGYFALMPKKEFRIKTVKKLMHLAHAAESETPKLERFAAKLVEARLHDSDFTTILRKTVRDHGIFLDLPDLQKVIDKISQWDTIGFYNPGTYRAYNSLPGPIPKFEGTHTNEKIIYIKEHLFHERKIAEFMQQEFNTLMAKFGSPTKNQYFINVDYIIHLSSMRRRKKIKNVTFKNDIIEDRTPDYNDNPERINTDGQSKISKMYSQMVKKINDLKDSTVSFFKLPEEVRATNTQAQQTMGRINRLLDDYGSMNLVEAYAKADFGSVQTAFNSVGAMVSAMFQTFIEKFGSLFGINLKCTIDITTLFFYYITWINTTSKMVKVSIVLALLTQLGVLDEVINLLKYIYSSIIGTVTVKVREDHFAAAMQTIENKTTYHQDTVLGKIKKNIQENAAEERKKIVVEEQATWLETLLGFLETHNAEMIGAVAVAAAAYLGYQSTKSSERVGTKICQGMRNVSFFALGMAAIPRIFTTVIGIWDWVKSKILKLVKKDYKEKIAISDEIKNWLEESVFSSVYTPIVMFQDHAVCVRVMDAYRKGKAIQPRAHTCGNSMLISTFTNQLKVVEELQSKAYSAALMNLQLREIFHIQLTSDAVGIGKTDLAHTLIKTIKEGFKACDDKIIRQLGYEPLQLTSSALGSGVYPMQENLKHADNYYNQAYAFIDEDTVFYDMDQDSILSKMSLLSGTPQISQQAALGDKGRMYTLEALISNTNNPFVKPQGMIKPEALWRRRNLFSVRVNPKYLTNDLIDEVKIKEVNRTLGEHLLITHLEANPKDGARTPVVVGNTVMEDMSIEQFHRYCSVLVENHYYREENRLMQKSAKTSAHRRYFSLYLEQMKQTYAGLGPAESFQDLVDVLMKKGEDEIIQKTEQFTETYRTDNKIPISVDAYKLNLQKCLNDRVAMLKHYAKHSKVYDEMEAQANAYLGVDCTPDGFELKKEDHELVYSELYYSGNIMMIRPSRLASPIIKGKPNWNNFKFLEQKTRENVVLTSSVVYMCKDPALMSEETRQVIHYWLNKLSNALSQGDLDGLVKIHKTKMEYHTRTQVVKAEWANIYNTIRRSIGSTASWLYDKVIKTIGEKFVNGMLVSVAIVGAFFALSLMGQMLSPNYETKSYNRYEKQVITHPQMKVRMEQSDTDIMLMMRRATYKAYLTDGMKVSSFHMIGLKGSLFLVNQHAITSIRQSPSLWVYDHSVGLGEARKEGSVKQYHITDQDISHIPGTDACIINIKGHRHVANIFHHFIQEYDLERNMVHFDYCHYNTSALRDENVPTMAYKFQDTNRDFYSPGWMAGCPVAYDGAVYPHDRVIGISHAKLNVGDSGCAFMHGNSKIPRKVMGILLSGKGDSDFIGVLTQEQLAKAIEAFPIDAKFEKPDVVGVPIADDHPLVPALINKNAVFNSPYKGIGITKESGYTPSPIQGAFPVTSEPAIQDYRDPRLKGQEHKPHHMRVSLTKSAGIQDVYFDQEEEKFMMSALTDMFVHYVPGLKTIRLYSTYEAIAGVRKPGSNCIDITTSAGLPYSKERGTSGKRPFIDRDPKTGSWNISMRVYHDVAIAESYYDHLIVPLNFKTEVRKKELVGPNKIYENPKTRTVGMGSMIQLIIYHKCTKDLYTLVKNTWDEGRSLPFALGVDLERHTPQIIEHLNGRSWGANTLDFDVKAWESGVTLKLLLMTTNVKYNLLRRAYLSRGEELPKGTAERLTGLAIDYTHAEVLYEDIWFQKRAGLLSGHPGTFMENSEIHYMLFFLVIRRILKVRKPEWATIPFIRDHVRLILAADDIMVTVSPLARRLISVDDIVAGYGKLGFQLTDANKGNNICFKSITEAQFLKHTFDDTPKGWVARPNISIIYQLLNWISTESKLSIDDQFTTNIDNAMRFAYFRGREEYETLREQLNTALQKTRRFWSYSYDEMTARIRQSHLDKERIHQDIDVEPEN